MRHHGTALAPFLAAVLLAGSAKAVEGQPPEPERLVLSTWGMPGEPRFKLTLGESGTLEVVKQSLPITSSGTLTETRATANLPTAAALTLIRSALDVDDFDNGCDKVADGTSAALEVWASGRHTERRCHGAAGWPQGKGMKSLLETLNHHLPRELQVF
jgi:hypothetical protein